ncbi:MAG TPA: LPFR motif small protein [Streptosporangiaceae bacterium]|nr:LPFR motif small protein [Streptosporangiaceae bacterium]
MRRITDVLAAIMSTIVDVITLPFRVLIRLLSPGRRRGTAPRRRGAA